MKLLLDESAPRRLASLYPEPFDVRPVPQMVWAGRGFAALVTVDQGMEPEQNVDNLPVPVIILIATRKPFAGPEASFALSCTSGARWT